MQERTGGPSEARGLTRRRSLAAGAAALAAAALPRSATAAARRAPVPDIGGGGPPTEFRVLQRLAREHSRGEPIMLVDLAAVDHNIAVVTAFARANAFAIRPALKVFGSVQLAAYILQRLPESRGLVFHLGQLDAFAARLPRGTDLLTGYPPTVDELAVFLGRRPRYLARGHRLRILVDSVPLMEDLARLSQTTRHPLPLEVAIELNSGEGRGGMDDAAELQAALGVLRHARERLKLSALLCYDGHATLTGAQPYRQLVALTARQRYRAFIDQLRAQASDLCDVDRMVRNGPASANMHNWAGSTEANEIAPGSAFVYPGYLDTFDHDGLQPALFQCAPVMRITSDSPSVPLTQTTLPGATRQELVVKGGAWPSSDGTQPQIMYPPDVSSDDLSGGGSALTSPKGALALGDHVLYRPHQGEEGIAYFGALHAVRGGRVVRVWETLPRWGQTRAFV